MECLDQVDKPPCATVFLEYLPKSLSQYSIEGFTEVNETYIKLHVLFDTLFLNLSQAENHVHCVSFNSKAALGFR